MKILVVGLKTNPQVLRVKEEAEKRGHVLDTCLSSELVTTASESQFQPMVPGLDLTSYDVVYLWAVSKRRWEWFTAALYLKKEFGKKIVNNKIVDPEYSYFLSPAMDYWRQKDNKIPFPKSVLIHSEKSVDSVSKEFEFPVIVKASPSSKGRGVFKAENTDDMKKIIQDTREVSLTWIVRELIPNDGDIRVFTVGYKAIGAMKRIPKEGDFRSNISQGGEGEKFDLKSNPKVQELAEKVSELVKTEIAGVDVILDKNNGKPYVLEVNPGPQFTGLEEYTSVNAAEEIVKYFESI